MADLKLERLTKSFGAARAVDNISLDLVSGEFVTLLGPSGCGKTTTLRMVAGLEKPDGGVVRLGGTDVTSLPPFRRNIGMVFQSHALFPHMTVAENVAFGLRMRKVDKNTRRQRVREALDLVRLADYLDRYPHQLSGGQQQRVALARALVVRPDILLLDEPFGALDRKLREALQEELRQLTRKIGITSLFVTHDQEEALILSDRICVMNAGRIDQIGTPNEIFERPETHFVADFMGVGNFIAGTVSASSNGETTIDTHGRQVDVSDRQAMGRWDAGRGRHPRREDQPLGRPTRRRLKCLGRSLGQRGLSGRDLQLQDHNRRGTRRVDRKV